MILSPSSLITDVEAMCQAIERQKLGYVTVYNLYTTLTTLDNTDPHTDQLIYEAFDDLRKAIKRFGPHLVVLYLDMQEKKKLQTLKLVCRII